MGVILANLISLIRQNFFLMFLNLVCPTYMLANNSQAGINILYGGTPHMLKNSMLATNLLEAIAQAAFNAAFLLVTFIAAPVFSFIDNILLRIKNL